MLTAEPNNRLNSASQTTHSIPSASSVSNNGQPRLNSNQALNATRQQAQPQLFLPRQVAQQQQQVYYTPPIFAYNNFDQNRPATEQQLGLPYGLVQQHQQLPPMGVPEVPLSVDEYNARQARLRQFQPQPVVSNEVSQVDRYGKQLPSQRLGVASVEPQFSPPNSANQQQNLLADPQQQQRHKQQMLDRQILFGQPQVALDNNLTNYYPDPAAAFRNKISNHQEPSTVRPPYAHNMLQQSQQDLDNQLRLKQSPQSRISPANHRMEQNQPLIIDNRSAIPLKNNNQPASNQLLSNQQSQKSTDVATIAPACARRREDDQTWRNSAAQSNSTQPSPVLFCNDDSEYPMKDIMRALESYAAERSIEQLLPQILVQIQQAQHADGNTNRNLIGDIQRQLTLDSLQPSISGLASEPGISGNERSQQQVASLFPSANYEQLCRSNVFMSQPKRAKNLLGQWKIIVNLPGHKYRGIAVSQMVRIEECSQPNSECIPPGGNARSSQVSFLSKSRCLQHYDNQRLLAWSHQQGLHTDIFRVPIACSCHIRR